MSDQTVDVATLRKNLAAIIEAGHPVIVTRYGRQIAKLVPLEDKPVPPPLVLEDQKPESWSDRNAAQAKRDELLKALKKKP